MPAVHYGAAGCLPSNVSRKAAKNAKKNKGIFFAFFAALREMSWASCFPYLAGNPQVCVCAPALHA
jgi:hypothetical protein